MSKLKIKKGHLFSVAILIALAIIILIVKPGIREFQISVEETLEQTVKRSHLISYNRYEKLQASNGESNSAVMLVDLRSPEEFESGHLPDAINIPAEKLLDKQSVKFFKMQGNIKVMYSDSSYKAAQAWTILYQMGCTDLVILETTGSLADLIEKGSDADPVMIYNDERKQFIFESDTTVTDYFPET
jgi:rhodanese-related sulfurtransferase